MRLTSRAVIAIMPVNAIDSSMLGRLALCLEERFLFTCTVERVLRLSPRALNTVRRQLFLGTLLSEASSHAPVADGYRLFVTDFDLYKTSHRFIFGDASEEHRIAVVSLHRLRGEFNGEPNDENLLFQRLLTESVHELGHAFGLKHCFNTRCAMSPADSLYEIDAKISYFCEPCERRVRRTADS